MFTIMPAFESFPEEGAIIGRLLAGYGELELQLSRCVNSVRNDYDMVFRAMFRPRGETQRIDIADAIGRPAFASIKLETKFAMTISTIRHCLKIRNQYAHCYWTDDFGRSLGFVELEETARGCKNDVQIYSIPVNDIDIATLKQQEAYFIYARDWLRFLEHEGRLKNGLISSHPFQAPKQIMKAPLHKP